MYIHYSGGFRWALIINWIVCGLPRESRESKNFEWRPCYIFSTLSLADAVDHAHGAPYHCIRCGHSALWSERWTQRVYSKGSSAQSSWYYCVDLWVSDWVAIHNIVFFFVKSVSQKRLRLSQKHISMTNIKADFIRLFGSLIVYCCNTFAKICEVFFNNMALLNFSEGLNWYNEDQISVTFHYITKSKQTYKHIQCKIFGIDIP